VTRSLQAILLALLAALGIGVAACGGGDEASSKTDVNTLLSDTFKGNKNVKSGKLNLALKINAKGAQGVNGPITLSVAGPFQSQGKQKLPKFDIDFSFAGAGQNIKAGLTSTGDKAFVNFNGTEYAVSPQVFNQFKAGYEQAQQNRNSKQQQSLSSLGLDPRQWLTNPKNEGDAKVGDTDVIKVTGGVDVNKLLDDVNQALQKTKQLGVQGTQNLPSQLTAAQKKQVTDSIKNPRVEIYTGKDDKILRRMVIALGIVPAKGSGTSGSADINFDLSLADVNEDQEVSAPSNAQPFDQLLSKLGGLGLGGLGSGGAGTSGGTGSTGSTGGTSSGSSNNKNLEKYSKCVSDAGNDVAKARKCAALLTG
jgi:hypothetical protein